MAVKKWLHVVGVTQVVAEEADAVFDVVAAAVFAAVVVVFCCCAFSVKGEGCGTVSVARELSTNVSLSSSS